MKNKATGFKRLIAASRFSALGLKAAYNNEAAFRQECWLAVVLIPLSFWLGDSALQVGLLIASVLFIMIVELLNTAIEAVVDRVGSEFHELSGFAKDAGSAAVLLAMILGLVVWLGVLLN